MRRRHRLLGLERPPRRMSMARGRGQLAMDWAWICPIAVVSPQGFFNLMALPGAFCANTVLVLLIWYRYRRVCAARRCLSLSVGFLVVLLWKLCHCQGPRVVRPAKNLDLCGAPKMRMGLQIGDWLMDFPCEMKQWYFSSAIGPPGASLHRWDSL